MKTLSKDQGPETKDQRPFSLHLPIAPSLRLLSSVLCPLFSVLCLLSSAPAARAQWQSTTYSLHGGWNAIYLHGDANYASIETVLPPSTNVVSVWRWNPNPSQTQFSTSTLIPSSGTSEWSVWTRGGSNNTLLNLTGQAAYLIECSGAAGSTYSVPIVHKVQPPRSTWVRNGANLLGFPTSNAAGYPTMANYFATFPVAIASNSKIYRYDGGPLGAANPIQVFSTSSQTVDRTQAYWFEAAVVSDFYAPLEISPSNLDGLIYGRNGSLISVRVRNRTAATVNLTVAKVGSTAAPTGQDQITGQVPLTYRTFNTTTNSYEFNAITGALPVVVGPQSTVELYFGLTRSLMTGATDALYASLLRFTDGGNLMDVYLPVSARVTSLSGLWIGDVAVTNVSNRTNAQQHTCTVTRTPSSGTATTVTSPGLASGTNTLTPLSLPVGTGGTLTYQWKKNGVAIDGATASTLVLTTEEVTASGAFGTTTPRSFPQRVILHVADDGKARLLSHVYMGKLAASPNNLGICTRETGLKQDEKATAQRFTAAHLPPETVLEDGTGSVAIGQTLNRTLTILYTAPTNPFVHTYHPDHDNRNARFDGPVDKKVESPEIIRDCSFAFTINPPSGTSSQGWGSTVIGGNYSETITGLHKTSTTVTGTFVLRRVSELGSITLN